MKKIYLAGGCFWGVQGYFKNLLGIEKTSVGYANGKTDITDYNSIKSTDHVEAVEIEYNQNIIRLEEILLRLFKIIDPFSLNKQGNDIGRQYRTGIYYIDVEDVKVIKKVCKYIEEKYQKEIVVEVEKLNMYILAEDYHQDYLDKNPKGYCHINLDSVFLPVFDKKYEKPELEKLKNTLSKLEFGVTQNSETEKPFSSELEDNYEKGIYVNIVTGEPIFLSLDKFDSGCGWPSFTRPILTENINYYQDLSHGMNRIEVKTKFDKAHLGHVFTDGPLNRGGLRYCINGASLRFVPYNKLDEFGYSDYKIFF